MNILLLFAIFASCPLFLDEVFNTFGLGRGSAHAAAGARGSERDEDADRSPTTTRPPAAAGGCFGLRWGSVIIRGLLCFTMVVAAEALGQKAASVIGLVGSLTMAPLGCIIPCLFYIKFHRVGLEGFNLKSRDGVMVVICGVLGVIGGILGSIYAVVGMVGPH